MLLQPFHSNSYNGRFYTGGQGADLGPRGRVQGVHPPLPPEMTCDFLIQLVFCEKKLCGLLVMK